MPIERKKRIKLLILPTPIGLNCNNFATVVQQVFGTQENTWKLQKKIVGWMEEDSWL
jgi:hypothetical protein